MNDDNLRRSRAEGPIAAGVNRHSYYGAVYESAYEQAALVGPIWTCDHDHGSEQAARDCAKTHLEERGSK